MRRMAESHAGTRAENTTDDMVRGIWLRRILVALCILFGWMFATLVTYSPSPERLIFLSLPFFSDAALVADAQESASTRLYIYPEPTLKAFAVEAKTANGNSGYAADIQDDTDSKLESDALAVSFLANLPFPALILLPFHIRNSRLTALPPLIPPPEF